MSKWVKIKYHSGVDSPVLQVSDAVATQMAIDALEGTQHKSYNIENLVGLRGDMATTATLVVHWEDVAAALGYNDSPYPPAT